MRKNIFILVLIFVSSTVIIATVEARSGCCSHHGGVCGCGCCDGTPLSATCAPYYNCGGYSSPVSRAYTPPPTPKCMSNSTYSSSRDVCVCNTGYAPSLNLRTCVKIPVNAHTVNSTTDIWMCNVGYKEVGNLCMIDTCGKNAEGIPPNCTCKQGYAPSLDKQTCISIPKNSHYTESKSRVWQCDYGYMEVKDACVKEDTSKQLDEILEINKKVVSKDNITQTKVTEQGELTDRQWKSIYATLFSVGLISIIALVKGKKIK